MEQPPTELLAAGDGWRLELVAYPSGTFIEFVTLDEDSRGVLRYSERLDCVASKGGRLREEAG